MSQQQLLLVWSTFLLPLFSLLLLLRLVLLLDPDELLLLSVVDEDATPDVLLLGDFCC
jgi:hypothetical protein